MQPSLQGSSPAFSPLPSNVVRANGSIIMSSVKNGRQRTNGDNDAPRPKTPSDATAGKIHVQHCYRQLRVRFPDRDRAIELVDMGLVQRHCANSYRQIPPPFPSLSHCTLILGKGSKVVGSCSSSSSDRQCPWVGRRRIENKQSPTDRTTRAVCVCLV